MTPRNVVQHLHVIGFKLSLPSGYQLGTVYVTTENISVWELFDHGALCDWCLFIFYLFMLFTFRNTPILLVSLS